MFTREALYAAVNNVRKEPAPPLEIQVFGQYDFEHPDSEESIWFLRGSRDDYRDAVHFWLKALQHVLETSIPHRTFGRASLYDENTLCKKISYKDFLKILTRNTGLKTAHDFHLNGRFQQAWLMSDEGLDLSALAQTDREFVAFFWDSTA